MGSTVANFSGWLYHLFVGRILGPEKYSELSSLFAIFYILNVLTGVIQISLVKFFSVMKAREEYGQANVLFWIATKKIAVAGVIGLVISSLFAPFLASYLHIDSYFYFFLIYIIFATSTITVPSGAALQGFQRFLSLTVISNIGMALRLITGVVGAFFGVGWTLIANILSNIGSFAISFIPLRFLFRYTTKPLVIGKSDAIGFGVPVLLTTLGITVLNSQDVLLVKHYFSSYDAGIYASLSVLGKIIFYASSAVGAVLFPLVAERKELKSDYGKSVRFGLIAVGIMSLIITVIYFVFPSLIILPFGSAFTQAAPYLGWFGIFVTFYTMATLLLTTLLALGMTQIWFMTITVAALQYGLIYFYHASLTQVIYVNIITAVLLFFGLLSYYYYGAKKTS